MEADIGVDSEGGAELAARSGAVSHPAWSSWGPTEVAPDQRWPGYRRRLQWLLAVWSHLHPAWDW